MPSSKKSRASRRYHSKEVKERRQVMSGPMIPNGRTDFLLLEKFIPFEFREELRREDVAESVEWLVRILLAVRYLIPSFLL